MRKLTIGTLTCDDFDGFFATLQAVRLYHPEVLGEIEFLILDHRPDSAHGKANESLTHWIKEPVRYVSVPDARGTAERSRLFDLAQTPYVLCLDSHVLLTPGSLRRLIDFFDSGADQGNLLQGPMVYDDLVNVSTHFEPVWRDQMLGIWATAWVCQCGRALSAAKIKYDGTGRLRFRDMQSGEIVDACACTKPFPTTEWCGHEKTLHEAGYTRADASEAPFEIPAQGLGLFACRKDSWLGFNPRFRGFGGEEVYIHWKYRAGGRKTLCLPWLKWLHRFGRPGGVPYPMNVEDRVRNYLIGHLELGLNPKPVLDHFKAVLPAERLLALLQESLWP